MNVTEKMHRIQLAANAWHAAMEVEKYSSPCTGCGR
jgi:hypothetical protein